MSHQNATVIHSITNFLFLTGSWVYNLLVHTERTSPVVFTDNRENEQVFPFEKVYGQNINATTTVEDMYIVSWGYRNGSGTLSPASGSDIDLALDLASRDNGSTGSGAGGSILAETPGTYNVSWDNDGSGSPLSFAFERWIPDGSVFKFR